MQLIKIITFTILIIISLPKMILAQSDTFRAPIALDEAVIVATRGGFNVDNFISIIKNDTTFYKAFKSIRLMTFNADNDIKVYNKKNQVQASYIAETKQIYRSGCRTMNVLESKTTGDFFTKKGNYNYFTAELYASLFFTKDKICNETDIVKGSLVTNLSGKSRIEKSKDQLKTLMFNPGKRVPGIPFVGNKVAIFEPEVAKMYDFELSATTKNGEEAYLFKAVPKSEYAKDVVINQFDTWFRKNDYSIIARDYSLSYDGLGYDFDIKISVDLKQVGNKLVPSRMYYNGNWKIVTQTREKVVFNTVFYY